MNFNGEFETHITFALSEANQWPQLTEWCQSRGLKCVYILLDRGVSASQPMITRHGSGSLQSELEKANQLRHQCEAAGFAVSRVKLEVAPTNYDVPQTVEAAALLNEQHYFEHHIKILLPCEADLSALKAVVVLYGAHLSRNARRVRDDGFQERFVPQRCRGVGRPQAKTAFEALLQTIEPFGFPVLESEEEFVVFDSNLALDMGWLTND